MRSENNLKIIYCASRNVGYECLNYLIHNNEIEILGVLSKPIDHDGWWDKSVRELATAHDLPLISRNGLVEIESDLIISVLFWDIFTKDEIKKPTYGAINFHQAELPRYRGSNSFSHAIMNARKDNYWKYGTTLHWIDEGVDTGPIIEVSYCEIKESDTAKELYKRVASMTLNLFKKWIPKFVKAHKQGQVDELIPKIPQRDEERVYYYPKDSMEDKYLPLKELKQCPEEEIFDRIRAYDFPPFEPLYTVMSGQKVYLTLSAYPD